jgi:mono/diheme cytochrome c family protein
MYPLLTMMATALLGADSRPDGSADARFRAEVAPILEARCVRCHGGTAKKGGLSLATSESARAGGDGGPAVVPGKPEESLLLEMVNGDKPEMPRGGRPLSSGEVAALRRWIAGGAHWPADLTLKEPKTGAEGWWAFRPLVRPKVPVVNGAGSVRTPIDAFVLQGLEARTLSPRPEADRRTLIRRLTYDLHGLPPSPVEVESFVNDPSPIAYDRLVDRLLASPRYGERWGRHWLDVVHYGDTHGYDKDKRRDHAWPYRDYVIRAFNEDRPYGQFIKEQLAGDILFPGDPNATVATGFIAAGPWDFVGQVELREGTVDKEKTRLLDRDDMLANAMSTFVSLTVHCARCHDHKFDPIPQNDYYRLQAVFAGVDRGDRSFASPERAARRLALERRRHAILERYKPIVQKINALNSPEVARLDDLIRDLSRQLAELPRPLSPSLSPTNGYHSSIHSDPVATAWVQVDLGAPVAIDEIRLIPARPTDFPDSPGFGFPVRFRVEIDEDGRFARPETVAEDARPDHLNADDEPYVIRPGGRVARFVRVSASRLWKRTGDYVFALSELEVLVHGENVALHKRVSAHDSIEGGRWSTKALVDGFDSRAKRPAPSDASAMRRAELRYQVVTAEHERKRLADGLIDPTLRADRDSTAAELAAVDAQLKAEPATDSVYAVQPHAPRPIFLLRRGDVEQPGAPVEPGALSCLPGLDFDFKPASSEDEGARRAALAEWIASPMNVLTWRSIANRVWHYHFGRGLVDTPNDFGRNGSLPTHPELLDWLAVEMLENGQSIKRLHRLIVTSAVYRQATRDNRSAARVDADNRLLWRMNRRRLDAEALRDSVLAISGTLDPRMGGPGFEPFRFKDDHSPIYDHNDPSKVDNPSVRRRTIYRFAVRSVPHPFLECLDCADPNINTPVRGTTITALQALAMLNDLFVIRQAQYFARRLEQMNAEPRGRIEVAFVLALGRPPRPEERDSLASYADRYGLAQACRLLFNINEFMFVD